MGVRESAKQLDEKEMRLQELTIEAGEKPELVFDPETDLLDSDWQGMKKELDQYRQNQDWGDFSGQAMAMKLLAAKEVKITSRGIECVMPSRETFQ